MTAPLKAQSFADLKPLRRTLQERAAQQAERERLRREAEQRARAERHLFQDAVGAVQPLKGQHERHWPAPVPPEPLPVQRQLDEARVLHESLSDEFEAICSFKSQQTTADYHGVFLGLAVIQHGVDVIDISETNDTFQIRSSNWRNERFRTCR